MKILLLVLILLVIPVVVRAQVPQLYTTGFGNSHTDTGTESSGVVKTTSGFVLMGAFMNYDVLPKVVMIFDSRTVPANGAKPRMAVVVPAAIGTGIPGQASLGLPTNGIDFRNGIAWSCSVTGPLLVVTDGCYAQVVFQ